MNLIDMLLIMKEHETIKELLKLNKKKLLFKDLNRLYG